MEAPMSAGTCRLAVLLLAVGTPVAADPPEAPAPRRSAQQIAMLRWYEANGHGASYDVDMSPRALAFDGAHMWVAGGPGLLKKLRASDGVELDQVNTGALRVEALAIDGSHIWIVGWDTGMARVRKFPLKMDRQLAAAVFMVVQPAALHMIYDGTNVWVSGEGPELLVFSGSDASLIRAVSLPSPASGLAFDGTHVWATCAGTDVVMKVHAGGGDAVRVLSVESPQGLAFDGDNMWVAHSGGVTRWSPGTGQEREIPMGGASKLVFDGVHIWVSRGHPSPLLTKLRAADGAVVAEVPVPEPSSALAFDGINVWTANHKAGTVTKR
jgi:hypothetical protein